MTSHVPDFSEPNRRILPSALSLSIIRIFISFRYCSAIVPHRSIGAIIGANLIIIGANLIIIGAIIGDIPYDISILHHYRKMIVENYSCPISVRPLRK